MIALTGILGCKNNHSKANDKERPPLRIWLGGDVNLGDEGNGQLKDIAGMVQGAIGIVNLEGPVTARIPAHGKLRLWNSTQALQELRALNVRAAGIANNHAFDAGQYAPVKTAEILRDNKILPAGGFVGPAIFKVDGVSIVVTAHDLTHGVPPKLALDLATARRKGDVLIATFHVTGPVSYLPRPELRDAVDIAYRSGADVIASHGTHVVGPVERRGHAVIAWGLGNVAFACDCTDEKDAILLLLEIQPHGEIRANVLPLQAGINSQPAEPSSNPDGIFNLLDSISSAKLERHGNYATF